MIFIIAGLDSILSKIQQMVFRSEYELSVKYTLSVMVAVPKTEWLLLINLHYLDQILFLFSRSFIP